MTNVSAVEKMAELMQQMEENSPRVAALQYFLKQVAEKVEEAEKRNAELEARCTALAAENARCKFEISRCHQTVDEMFKNRERWMDKEWLSSIWSTSKRLMEETPGTDAFLAEVRASGVEMAMEHMQSSGSLTFGDCYISLNDFADQLRKGVQS